MATSGFLPSIKCSHCNVEIPISMMGDHVCSKAPSLPSSRLNALHGPFAPTALKPTMGAPLSKPQKRIPPRLKPASTFDSMLHSHPTTVNSPQSPSHVIHSNRLKSSFKMPFLRSSTSPLPSRPTSPTSPIPQDCAFPPFPMARSQENTPTTPSEPGFKFPSSTASPQDLADTGTRHVAVSPRANGGTLMQKMNSITPGPFRLGEDDDFKASGHRKSPSMGSSRDFVRVPRPTSPEIHVQRPSTSNSNYTQHTSLSSISAGPRSTLNRSRTEVPAIPSIPRPFFRDESDGSAHVSLPSFDFGSFGPEKSSRTFPKMDSAAASLESHRTKDQINSGPSSHSHKPKPSIAVAAMQPLCEIGSTSSFKPSRSVRGRTVTPAVNTSSTAESVNVRNTELRDDRRLRDAPPVPVPAQAAEIYAYENPYHKPHESTSSTESYSSGVKSSSSRSSPPLNESPKTQNTHAFDDNSASDMFKGFIFNVEEPTSKQDKQTAGDIQPSRVDAPAPQRPVKAIFSSHEHASSQNLSPATSPDDYIDSSFAPYMNNLRAAPAPPAQSRYPEAPARRPSPANRGNCRGCGDFIQGKSVSSADGRLTGRYHKQCFVCQTCQRPFPTADFYVMNNQPYCARHYHELNDSLCTNCDRGIEGQYLETEVQQKFHPHCFSCQDCHKILQDDYFEFNGKTLCEQHAFGAARTLTPSSLGPGRRFPERRTTRLMMM